MLQKQNNNLESSVDEYLRLIEYVSHCKEILLQSPFDSFLNELGFLLEQSWGIKRGFEASISSNEIDKTHNLIKSLGGLGGKLSGAGGGGFLLELVPVNFQQKIVETFGANKVLKLGFEPLGSRVLNIIY